MIRKEFDRYFKDFFDVNNCWLKLTKKTAQFPVRFILKFGENLSYTFAAEVLLLFCQPNIHHKSFRGR